MRLRLVSGLLAALSLCLAPASAQAPNVRAAVLSSVVSFSPISLKPYIWLDPSDLSTDFQDSACTVPAAVGQTVGCIKDKSGKGYNATQATASKRPLLSQSGSSIYLVCDGVDDALPANGPDIPQPTTRVTALRMLSWSNQSDVVSGYAGDTELVLNAASPGLSIYAGAFTPVNSSLAVNSDGVASELLNGASSSLTIDKNLPVTGNSGTNHVIGNTLCSWANSSGHYGNARIYGVVIVGRALNSSESASLTSYLANKQGRSL